MAETTTAAEAEHIEPTGWSRVLVCAELLAVPACMIGGFWLAYWLLRTRTIDGSAICNQLLQDASGILAAGFVMLALGIDSLRRGWRIWTSRQFPAPGENVFFRRVIERGPGVRMHALGSVLMGMVFLGVPVWLFCTVEKAGSLFAPCG